MKRTLVAIAASFILVTAMSGPCSGSTTVAKGRASWYDYVVGEAAAGPALRKTLGKNWRGKVVKVCSDIKCVRVKLTDWCQCYKGTASERVIDLNRRSFSALAPLSAGLVKVEVRK